MSRVVGRRDLLAGVHDLLEREVPVALSGPAGIGKTTLLDALEHRERARPQRRVLRAAGSPAERALPYAALRDLLEQLPRALATTLPGPARRRVGALLDGRDPPRDPRPADQAFLCATVMLLLERHAERGSVLLLLDDAQWLDTESACVLGYARRRRPARIRMVVTVGPGPGHGVDLTDLHHVPVPPLDAGATIELLGAHGVAPHVAQRLHAEAGGLPSLALALGGAAGARPSLLGHPRPLPVRIEQVLRARVEQLPEEVRDTLETAALLHRPSVRQLERTGRIDAEEQVRRAAAAGVLARGPVLRFIPPMLAEVVSDLLPARRRAERHCELAGAATTPAEQLRHRALADPRPDPALAAALGRTARECVGAGDRELAAELYLLAAHRAAPEQAPERAEWLAATVETAAPGNHAGLVDQALAELEQAPSTPAQMVRVRLALPELAGTAGPVIDEVLAAALGDAGDDDRLVAMVLLQRSRMALTQARCDVAVREAGHAVRLLEAGEDDEALATALTTYAAAARWTGADHEAPLARAVRLSGPEPAGFVHTSAAYLAARFALYDDRAEEAWTAYLSMLALVERGNGMDQVHVLRCLVEVAVRTGRCPEARQYATRAVRVAEEFGLDPHTGWFIAALAELAGGDPARARTIAERGVRAATERGDTRYLQRHLLLVGQAALRLGDARGAAQALERIAAIEEDRGLADPSVNRWQPELVEALVRLGRPACAADLLARTRARIAVRRGGEGLTAQLDRAEAVLLNATGDPDGALELLERAEKLLAETGLRLELGRALLTRAHVERRRRRAAAARTALGEARALFEALDARGWVDQVDAELAPERGVLVAPVLERLTGTEARIAREVAAGASNREIAERTYLSVKTVEATLTRIYRKLDVRSRTQLAALLVPAPPE